MKSGKHPVLVCMLILYYLLVKPAILYKTKDDNSWTAIKLVKYVIKCNLFLITGSAAPEESSVSHLFQSELGLLKRDIFS